jgi:hypothetical protein
MFYNQIAEFSFVALVSMPFALFHHMPYLI